MHEFEVGQTVYIPMEDGIISTEIKTVSKNVITIRHRVQGRLMSFNANSMKTIGYIDGKKRTVYRTMEHLVFDREVSKLTLEFHETIGRFNSENPNYYDGYVAVGDMAVVIRVLKKYVSNKEELTI